MRPSAPRKDVLSAMDGNSRPLHKPTSCNNAVLDTEVPPMMSKSARQTRKGGTSAAECHAGVKPITTQFETQEEEE